MRFKGLVSEMVSYVTGGLRSFYRLTNAAFFGPAPAYDKTVIDMDMARQLYRNDGTDANLGGGFCAPIIDRAVEFIGIPQVSSDDEADDELVNEAIERAWKPVLTEMFRNAMRDSKTYVRIWQPLMDDPLATDEEREMCTLTIIDPERVKAFIRDPRNPNRVEQVIVVTKVEFLDEVQPKADPKRGSEPQVKEHEIWEVITPEEHRYYDKTDDRWLDSWRRPNPYRFVAIEEVFNEYDSTLSGGQSDLESVYPFIKAFHEVMRQVLQAHKYHSTPKLRFKVRDVAAFLANNFPDTIDPETRQPIPGSAIPWQGREVLFIGEDEDIDFIQINSILGDSKTLLEFLVDCISIASQTPEWAFMRVEGGTSQGQVNAQTVPFEKKIERKRTNFTPHIQRLIKMMLKLNNREPRRVEILWNEIMVDNLLTLAQALQQFTMTLEVLLERKLISENTAREALRRFRIFRTMKPPEEESSDAEENLSLEERSVELDKDAQIEVAKAAPKPALPAGSGNGNAGRGNKQPRVSSRNGGGRNE